MRVFLAGIIQGGRTDTSIHPQNYRSQIRHLVNGAIPAATFVDPHAAHPDRLGWSRADQRALFLRYVEEAGRCDLLIAWLPAPSMGTAVEMYEARRNDVPVVAVGPLDGTWAVFSLASTCVPDLTAFAGFVGDRGIERLVGTRQAVSE